MCGFRKFLSGGLIVIRVCWGGGVMKYIFGISNFIM